MGLLCIRGFPVIFFSRLLLVSRKASDFCVLKFDLVNLQKVFIRSKSFMVDSLGSFIRNIPITDRDVLSSSISVDSLDFTGISSNFPRFISDINLVLLFSLVWLGVCQSCKFSKDLTFL